jgi:hypothetical protein
MIPCVTDVAGVGADDARVWDKRLGWAFGLIADDPAVRTAALVRLAEARRKVVDALGWSNEMWWLTSGMW